MRKRLLFLSTGVLVLLALWATPVLAVDDENISSALVTPAALEAGASTSYSFTANLTNTEITDLYILLADATTQSPLESGYDWDNTTLGSLDGLSGTGELFAYEGSNIGYHIAVSSTTLTATIELDNLVNPPAGCYYVQMTSVLPAQEVNPTDSEPFAIGDGSCTDVGEGPLPLVENVVAAPFGTNIGVTWDEYLPAALEDGQQYGVLYDVDPVAFQEGGSPLGHVFTDDTTYIISGLEPSTTYSVQIEVAEPDARIAESEIIEVTTDATGVASQQFTKPKIKKKNKAKETFVVNLKNWKDTLSVGEESYVDSVYVTIGSKKKVSKAFTIDPSKNSKKIKKKFTHRYTKKGKPVYIRVWAEYTTDEVMKKSKRVKVKLF